MNDRLMNKYYDAMELIELGELSDAEEVLLEILDTDPDFVAGHVGLVAVYQEGDYMDGVREYTQSGYEATKNASRHCQVI